MPKVRANRFLVLARSRQKPQNSALGPGGPGIISLLFYKEEEHILEILPPYSGDKVDICPDLPDLSQNEYPG
jgi:hypothetical protein